jgi:hypothetical protein
MSWLYQAGFSTRSFFSLPPASAGLLLGSKLDPEYGGDMFLRNVWISQALQPEDRTLQG